MAQRLYETAAQVRLRLALTPSEARRFLQGRGLFLSKEATGEEIAEAFDTQILAYSDILKLEGPVPKGWQRLVQEEMPDEAVSFEAVRAKLPIDKFPEATDDVVRDIVRKNGESEMWSNDLYVVIVRREIITHISIRRQDRQPVSDWAHKQLIKNQLAGREVEAVELYPAESRLVDGANQYHLWCFPRGEVIPVGFNEGRVTSSEEVPVDGAQQRYMGGEGS